jgi:hypothetical protein
MFEEVKPKSPNELELQNPVRPGTSSEQPVNLPPNNNTIEQFRLAQKSALYPGEAPGSLQRGVNLGNQLVSPNKEVRDLFRNFTDVSGLNSPDTPRGRFTEGYARGGDLAFQEEVRGLVQAGTINRKSFVISNTGHDIPVLAELTQHGLGIQGTFRIPADSQDPVGLKANRDQAQTWGDEIQAAFLSSDQLQTRGALFAGLEAHRSTPIDARTLPSVDELKRYGIKNVVYLIEGAPSQNYTINDAPVDVREYLRTLERGGLSVVCRGIDSRLNSRNGERPELDRLWTP